MASHQITQRVGSKSTMKHILLSQRIIAVLLAISGVLANTESLVFRVPEGEYSSAELTTDNDPLLVLKNTNRAIGRFEVPIDNTRFEVELKGVVPGDTYQAKFCWTAANPVEINEIGFAVDKSSSLPQDKTLKSVVYLQVSGNSYPELRSPTVPINVSVAAVRFGIPVDMYATIIYIALLMTLVYLLNSHYDLYTMLRNF
ncbi:LADA_0D07624g1_1 [Lachancea dasiensis]|uniref:LADA_0D07624g1_1 n=1 Tax=Lachancea dasiensis TaxID=1072105 RepID=A0A1G4J6K6_9SACH|nr:LADA_0D07624g1_1 [Lachancea dasiensis]